MLWAGSSVAHRFAATVATIFLNRTTGPRLYFRHFSGLGKSVSEIPPTIYSTRARFWRSGEVANGEVLFVNRSRFIMFPSESKGYDEVVFVDRKLGDRPVAFGFGKEYCHVLPVAVAAMPMAEPGQSQSQAEEAEAMSVGGGNNTDWAWGGLGALQAPQGAPETKHKPLMGATVVFACTFLRYLCL